MSNNYDVSSYSIFDNAISTNNEMATNIESHGDEILNETDPLYDSSVFDGPIANICQEQVPIISEDIFQLRDSFTPISAVLATFSANYQQADTEAGETVSSVG